jgi:hypothetical protein
LACPLFPFRSILFLFPYVLFSASPKYFELDMKQYRAATDEDADNPAVPSSTGGDYSPANPWDAPGMSASDFI